MKSVLPLLGTLSGWAGVLVCLGSALLRVFGVYQIAGSGTIALFTGGIGLMIAGCFFKLEGSR